MKLNHVIDAYNDNASSKNERIVTMSQDQIELVNAAKGSGWLYSVSGECNSDGASCNFIVPLSRFIQGY